MRKSVFFIVIIFIFCPLLLSANDTGKKRLAILPFSSKGNTDSGTLEVMFENFTIALVDSGLYNIVERGQLDKALGELKFQRGDVFDDSQAAELGKMAGAQIVVFGSVNYANNTYYVNIRGIDVTTGIVTFGKREQTKSKGSLINLVDKLAKALSSTTNTQSVDTKFANNENQTIYNAERKDRESKSTQKVSEDQKFIDKYYKDKWVISPDSYEENIAKYKFFNGVGIGLAVGGGTLFLMGIIFIALGAGIAFSHYEEGYRFSYISGYVLGPIFTVPSLVITPFCAIPFYFANRVANIYKKTTGEKLSFWEKTNFDTRIVTTKNSLTNEYYRKISFDLIISL